jgi:hypothetical protein
MQAAENLYHVTGESLPVTNSRDWTRTGVNNASPPASISCSDPTTAVKVRNFGRRRSMGRKYRMEQLIYSNILRTRGNN